ncbi:uncharacterized protein At4g19900-like isoform X1 [Solanum lycopersicum]|uniref:uncharacterized protein At4g19900-like isoform X1 n=1 Tax=Solanum lycopersicum TaxID=4081 RepID=UPI003748DEF6
MFTARYQRGLESVLNCHRDACVVVFSETIELNFFSGFVKDGFKVAVVMPNLDELLLGTPTHVFASFCPFVMECLKESYDYTQLRWNGADLLTRIASNFSVNGNLSGRKREIKFQPSFVFFPIGHNNITRYFLAPAMETEKAEQDMLFKTIVKEAVTFHFWNGLTSAMVPEAGSLAHRLINYNCLRCSDTL